MANIEVESVLEELEKLTAPGAFATRDPRRGSNALEGDALEKSIRGFRLYEQARYREARALFLELVTLNPRQAFHRAALGLVHLAMDELNEAERELTRSIALSDREPSAYVNRGEIYLRQGRYAHAARDFERAVKLLPDAEDPVARRARLLASTAQEMLASVGGAARPAPAHRRAPARKPKKAPSKAKGKARKSKARRTGRTRRE